MQITGKIRISLCVVFFLIAPFVSTGLLGEELSSLLEKPEVQKALSTLDAKEYSGELGWFSADSRGGREPGTAGSIEAGDFAAGEFSKLGLKPLGDPIDGEPSYFQTFERGGRRGLLPGHCLTIDGKSFAAGKEWSLLGGCSKVDLKDTEVVFAGYGITAPEFEYDDYEGIDAQDKIVLILRHEPQEKDTTSAWKGASGTRHSYFTTKIENAGKHGAKAVLFVNGPIHHDPDRDPLGDLSTRASSNSKIPMIHVRGGLAKEILGHAGTSLADLQKKIDTTGKPASLEISGPRIDLHAEVGYLAKARNVIGLLEGSDPVLKNEVLVIGAHYDHLGLGAYGSRTPKRKGEVHNGADDNGSGSIGVIELAEAFVQADVRPRRSILFQLYDAEEKGLLGSRHYVSNPFFPLEKTVAMINLDMIAHVTDKKCSIMGTGTAKEWEAILKEAEFESPVTWRHSEGGFGGSDQSSFLSKKIPVLFFFSGIHKAYHTPDDDLENCNVTGAVDVLNVAFKTALIVANSNARPTFQETGRRRGPRATFGVMVESAEEGKPGLRISRIIPGGGAEKAGLLKGDILLAIDDEPIEGRSGFRNVLRRHKPGDVVKIRYQHGDQEQMVEVSLGSA